MIHFTEFGVIFIILSMYSWMKPVAYSIRLLLIASTFQAASILEVIGINITPIFFSQIILIVRLLFQGRMANLSKLNSVCFFAILFCLYSAIATLLYPILFEGIFVFTPKVGIDTNYLLGGTPLYFSISNINQIILLLVNVFCFVVLFKNNLLISDKFLINSYLIAVCIFLCIGFWQYFSHFTSLPFPESFFRSNSSYTQEVGVFSRLNVTFVEPSVAGAFIASAFWSLFFISGRISVVCRFLLLILLIGNISGTGLVTFFGGFFIYFMMMDIKTRLCWLLFLSLCIFPVIIYYMDNIIDLIMLKLSSTSGVNRFGADAFSIKLFWDTYLIGVGLGSHRSSSFLFTLLASVGLIGTILFFYFIVKLLKALALGKDRLSSFAMMNLLTVFVSLFIAVPDLSFSILWNGLYIAALLIKQEYNEYM